MSTRALLEKRTQIVAEMRSITTSPAGSAGDLSAEQSAKFDSLKTELEGLEKRIDRARVLDEAERRAQGQQITGSGDGRFDDACRDFSLRKAIAGAAGMDVDWGREKELSAELARRTGHVPHGILAPLSVFHRRIEQRTLLSSQGSPDSGGANLTFTDHRGDLFIDALRARMVVQRLGARVLSGLMGSPVDIPKLSSASGASWIAEDAALGASDPGFAKVQMEMKTVGCLSEYSRNLLIQSDPSVEQLLRMDFAQVIARAVDAAALNGAGGDEPTGILNTSGLDTTPAMGSAPTWADVLTLIELIEDANAEGSGFATHPSAVRLLRSTLRAASTDSRMLMESPTELAGYPLQATTGMPSTLGSPPADAALVFGNWNDIMIGYWSGVDFLTNPFESASYARGNVKVRALLTADVAVRHIESFAACTDLTP